MVEKHSNEGHALQQRNRQPHEPHKPAAQHGGDGRSHAVPLGRRQTLGAGIALGDADGLIHQLLRADAAAVSAENENCLFKDLRVRGVHHDDPAGNAFNQMYALLTV